MQNKAEQILQFMKVLDRACLVKRATRLSDGQFETDSSHTFKLCFLCMLVYPYLKHEYNYTRLLELALVHDIAEAETGDYPRSVQRRHPELKAQKDLREREAMLKYKEMLPKPLGEHFFDLYQEYEDKKTPEACLVTALDKIDANLQANQYHDGDVRYWLDLEDGEEYLAINTEKKHAVAILDEKIVEDVENAVIALTKGNIKKCKLKP